MKIHLFVAVALLALPALLPTVSVVGMRPTALFICPLVGALFAAWAVALEVSVTGSLLFWFVAVAAAANGAALVRLRRAGRQRRSFVPSPWSVMTSVVLIGTLVWPLSALRRPAIVWDGYAIWTMHSVLYLGGHHAFVTAVHDHAYVFTNLDYPPLASASGAIGFVGEGRVDLWLAVAVTGVLTACALGVAACGVVEIAAEHGGAFVRAVGIAAGAALCLVGFGLGSIYAVGGYADVLWASAAVGAMIYGLVLPRSGRALATALICATVAALSKNEGLTVGLIILVLMAIRYIPAISPRRRDRDESTSLTWRPSIRSGASIWMRRGIFALLMALPAVTWQGVLRVDGIGDNWFGSGRPGNGIGPAAFTGTSQGAGYRLRMIETGLWAHLHNIPVAVLVLALVPGSIMLWRARRRVGLGHDAWLWIVVVGFLVSVTYVYEQGTPEINWWLSTSIDRTTIFPKLVLYTAAAVWLVTAVSGLQGPRSKFRPQSAGRTATEGTLTHSQP